MDTLNLGFPLTALTSLLMIWLAMSLIYMCLYRLVSRT